MSSNTLSLLGERKKPFTASSRIAAFHLVAVRVGTCVVGVAVDGAVLPRERVLKGVAHVEEAPGDDDIVVKGHVETDLLDKEEEELDVTVTSNQINFYKSCAISIKSLDATNELNVFSVILMTTDIEVSQWRHQNYV